MARVTGDLFVELLTDPKNFHSFHLSILCVWFVFVCMDVSACLCVHTWVSPFLRHPSTLFLMTVSFTGLALVN